LRNPVQRKHKKFRKKIDNILLYSLSIDGTVEWSSLKIHSAFSESKPKVPERIKYKNIPIIPNSSSKEFIPKFTLLEKLFRSKRDKKEKTYLKIFKDALTIWESRKKKIEQENIEIDNNYRIKIVELKKETEKWVQREVEFFQKQIIYNKNIDELEKRYYKKDNVVVMEYCEIILNNSEYPNFFLKNFEVEYNGDNNILIVDYEIPALDSFPCIKEVKYIATNKELKEIYISETELNN